jgi:CheY-like chemotaxis protein
MNSTSSGSASAGKSATTPRRRRCNILIVEDHFDTIDLLRRLLTRHGHTVLMAVSCAEARAAVDRAAARSETIDLVIGDIGLPDGDGVELMAELKRRLGCPVVALTGHGMTADLQRCADAGIDRHLLKPVGVMELNTEMERVAGC